LSDDSDDEKKEEQEEEHEEEEEADPGGRLPEGEGGGVESCLTMSDVISAVENRKQVEQRMGTVTDNEDNDDEVDMEDPGFVDENRDQLEINTATESTGKFFKSI